MEIDVDASGRVLVPDHLKGYATLTSKVVVAGIQNRIEIWDEVLWTAYTSNIEDQANVLAQKLSDIGMI